MSSEVVKKPTDRRTRSGTDQKTRSRTRVKDWFKPSRMLAAEREEGNLEREERLERVRRQMACWQERRDQWSNLSWARGLVEHLVGCAMKDSLEAEGQRIAMTVSDVELIIKSHRRT